MRRVLVTWIVPMSILLTFFPLTEVKGQYFGQNKTQYETFNFKVYQTPHFEIYHYLESDSLTLHLSEMCEKWYRMHHQVFWKDTFDVRNPVIFYSNHADFQQTTTISGSIGVGTGGVTEALKNRVIMPITETYAQTNHVLGHEMVHAFQYHLLLHRSDYDTAAVSMSIQNLPLWIVEGLAEYLSIGNVDPHTALWLRDAVLSHDIPTLKDLTRKPDLYFPYRYGHAFWSFATSLKGDSIIVPFFEMTARYGYSAAIDSIFGVDEKTFSGMWKTAMKKAYEPYLEETDILPIGDKLLSEKNAGEMIIAPSVSPNAQYLAFFSNKNVFSQDLFLADAKSGKIIRKLSSVNRNTNIDEVNYIESSGTWSPTSDRFAFVTYSKGTNALLVVDVSGSGRDREVKIPGIQSFSNPAWSPNGEYLLFSGTKHGQTDLYLYNFKNRKVQQLTNTPEAEIQPAWSPDGTQIVYVKEKCALEGEGGQSTCVYDLVVTTPRTSDTQVVNVFPGALNLNPVFSSDGRSIYFLSDGQGFRNIYEYEMVSGNLYQLTNYFTGIKGITFYSPALSTDRRTNRLYYSYYVDNNYEVYSVPADSLHHLPADPNAVSREAARISLIDKLGKSIVETNLTIQETYRDLPADSIKQVQYKPKFKLDYISNSVQAGVMTGPYTTTAMAGGVNAWFSDILGYNQLFTGLALNGEIYDLAAQVAYVNQKRQLNWGASVSHIPTRYAGFTYTADSLFIEEDTLPVIDLILSNYRIFEDNFSIFTFYPLNKYNRVELSTSFSWYYNRLDRIHNYYFQGYKIAEERERNLPAPEGFNVQQVNAAYVGDNSRFGLTSPMSGTRYRIQVGQYFGEINMTSLLADYRTYYFLRPVGLAGRIMHVARYGPDAGSNLLSPLSIAYPTLIRGYDVNSFYRYQGLSGIGMAINQLFGSRILVGNIEVRLPFTGPENLAMIESRVLWTDWAIFFDGGLAWDRGQQLVLEEPANSEEARSPLFSTGFSFRINVGGYVVIEPYYAFPLSKLDREDLKAGVFGVNFSPGW